jgi:hypothetical protein
MIGRFSLCALLVVAALFVEVLGATQVDATSFAYEVVTPAAQWSTPMRG